MARETPRALSGKRDRATRRPQRHRHQGRAAPAEQTAGGRDALSGTVLHEDRARCTPLRHAPPALIFILVVLCFLPVLGNGFVNWDDPYYFLDNLNYRGLSAAHLRWMFTTVYMSHYQPLSWLTYGLVYSFWRLDPTGYHLMSLLLHGANAVLFYFLIGALWRQFQSGRTDRWRWPATAGALFFGIHPLRVEAVAWAPELQEVLCAFFFLLTLIAYLRMQEEKRARGAWRKWYVFSVCCFALSLLAKATGIMLPVILLALDVYPLRRMATQRGQPPPETSLLVEKIPYALVALAVGTLEFLAKQSEAMFALADHGIIARLMQASFGLTFYLWKTVLPFRLSPLYPFEPPLDLSNPKYALSALLVIGVTAGLIRLRHRWPWMLLAWTCFVVIVCPVLGFTQSGPQIAADRYTYLACLPWAALVAGGTHQLRIVADQFRRGWLMRSCGLVALGTLLAMMGMQTCAQTRVWKDSVTLWTHVIQIEPTSYFAYYNRGLAYRANGNLERALADYDQTIRLRPRHASAYYNRANVRRDRGDLDGALADYDTVIALDPRHAGAHNNRGRLRERRGDLEGAVADYRAALQLTPYSGKSRGAIENNLAKARAELAARGKNP